MPKTRNLCEDAQPGMARSIPLLKQVLGEAQLRRAWERDTQRLHLIALELAHLPATLLQQRLDGLEQWERWEVLEDIRRGCKD